jgi:cysteine desulfurase/selenocysteine lyase
MNDNGELIMAEYDKLSDKTKIVTVNHISNALGTVNP